jgi:hypothetical protein
MLRFLGFLSGSKLPTTETMPNPIKPKPAMIRIVDPIAEL